MRTFQIVIVSLCFGLLGVVAVILTLPKPASPSSGYPMRPQISDALVKATRLADTGNFNGAFKLLADANAFPNKTKPEIQQIDQIHQFVLERQEPHL